MAAGEAGASELVDAAPASADQSDPFFTGGGFQQGNANRSGDPPSADRSDPFFRR